MKFSRDVLKLNPELRSTSSTARARFDRADDLREHLRILAPDLPLSIRDWPFLSFRVDLAWPDARLCVEVNGGLHRAGGGKHATSRDHQKLRALVIAGYRVLVFTSSEVHHNPQMCVDDIRLALAQRVCYDDGG